MMIYSYQCEARRTMNLEMPEEDMLRHAVFGLCSEAGEVAGILQKEYQGHDFDRERMLGELGDCLWFIAEACTALKACMGDVAEANIEKLKKRYPDGFDEERSVHREEGDV